MNCFRAPRVSLYAGIVVGVTGACYVVQRSVDQRYAGRGLPGMGAGFPAIADVTATKTQQVDHAKDRDAQRSGRCRGRQGRRGGKRQRSASRRRSKAENKERAGKTNSPPTRSRRHARRRSTGRTASAGVRVRIDQGRGTADPGARVNTGNGSVKLSNTSGETLSVNNGSINVRKARRADLVEVTNGKTEMRDVRGR